ncbi:uncharacterized protein LOC128921961 [Zeugodacus cucurbitae]|uniref:uncharacterized protein LOC128921961 n=1 Tax=Zeugodacus cucurbitae TaxID=28588 RepID=UPI0023D93FE0|nr:uncharacterized protein LOC128921961 [Zeugodacus cucurbitae]
MTSQSKIIPENDLLRMFGNDIQINEQGDLTYTCVEEDTDLLNLLKKFDLETLFLGLKIKNIGLRAEFREKLFFWRKSKFGIEDETLSQTSKVVGWLEKNRHKDSPCSSNNSIRNAFGSQPLSTFLNDNSAGKQLIQYYEEWTCFTNKKRDAHIKIILEDVMLTKTKLRPEHFASIVEEIISLFPNEKESQDYYYIPRQRKKNPSGKLYSKYFNLKTKIRKSSPSAERSLSSEVRDPLVDENVEVDETLSLCLKTSLQKDINNWDEVIDKWQKTFTFRKKNLAKLSNSDFLQEWPILKDYCLFE